MLPLPYEQDIQATEGKRVFFGIELEDGTMTRLLYWPETGYIHYGAMASERMRETFEDEMNAFNY